MSHLSLSPSLYSSFVETLDPECPFVKDCIKLLCRDTLDRAHSAAAAAASNARRRAALVNNKDHEVAQYDAIIEEAQRRVQRPLLPPSDNLFGGSEDGEEDGGFQRADEHGVIHFTTDYPELFGQPQSERYAYDNVDPREVSRASTFSQEARADAQGGLVASLGLEHALRRTPSGLLDSGLVLARPRPSIRHSPAHQQVLDRLAARRRERAAARPRSWDTVAGSDGSGTGLGEGWAAATSEHGAINDDAEDVLLRHTRRARRQIAAAGSGSGSGAVRQPSSSAQVLGRGQTSAAAAAAATGDTGTIPASASRPVRDVGLDPPGWAERLPVLTAEEFNALIVAQDARETDTPAADNAAGAEPSPRQAGSPVQADSGLRRNYSIRRSGFHTSYISPPNRSSSTSSPSRHRNDNPHSSRIDDNASTAFDAALASYQSRLSTAALANDVARAGPSGARTASGSGAGEERGETEFEAHTSALRAAQRRIREQERAHELQEETATEAEWSSL